jgi:hypothetical protein
MDETVETCLETRQICLEDYIIVYAASHSQGFVNMQVCTVADNLLKDKKLWVAFGSMDTTGFVKVSDQISKISTTGEPQFLALLSHFAHVRRIFSKLSIYLHMAR